MGGLALKEFGVKRKNKKEHDEIIQKVCRALKEIEVQIEPLEILAYREKQSFGDADILCSSEFLNFEKIELLMKKMKSKGYVSNVSSKMKEKRCDVYSIEVDGFQVDLISLPRGYKQIAWSYFNYNDVGNLMGCVANAMGFKFGFFGLELPLYDMKSGQQYDKVPVSTDIEQIINFLGFDFEIYKKGFDNLDEIFKYVSSGKYMSPDLFVLENRNAKARVRDAKRTTYTKFLEYLKTDNVKKPDSGWFNWSTSHFHPYESNSSIKVEFLEKAKQLFPNLNETIKEANDSHELRKQAKVFLDDKYISQKSAIKQKTPEFGVLMSYCKRAYFSHGQYVLGAPERQQWLEDTIATGTAQLEKIDLKKMSEEEVKNFMDGKMEILVPSTEKKMSFKF